MSDIGSTIFKSGDSRVWIQPSGPNTPFLYAGCYRITGSPTTPRGDVTLLRCPSPNEPGAYVIVGRTTGTPGNPTMQITAPLDLVNYLMDQKCAFNLQYRMGECNIPNDPAGWDNMFTFTNCVVTQDAIDGLDHGPMDGPTNTVIEVVADITFEEKVFIVRPTMVAITVTAVANAHLMDISFCDSASCAGACGDGSAGCQVGYAISAGAGSVEQIHKTVDGGSSWTHLDSPFTGIYDLITAIDCSGDVVIVTNGVSDGLIARSADGGATWAVVDTGINDPLNDVFMLNAAQAWVCSNNGSIAYTGNGGLTWTIQDAGVATNEDLLSIAFYGGSVGIAVGTNGAIVRTLDGETWSAVTSGVAVSLRAVAPVNEFVWFAGGASATMLYSTDRGGTWTAGTWPGAVTDTINGIKFCSQFGFAVATTNGGAGVMYQSVDGGYSWQSVDVPSNAGLNAVECCDPNTVFAAAQAGVLLKVG